MTVPQKGHNFVINRDRVTVNFSHCLLILYIYTKVRENISKRLEVIKRTLFPYKVFPWNTISSKTKLESRYFFPGHCLIIFDIYSKVRKNIPKSCRVLLNGHEFPTKNFNGAKRRQERRWSFGISLLHSFRSCFIFARSFAKYLIKLQSF